MMAEATADRPAQRLSMLTSFGSALAGAALEAHVASAQLDDELPTLLVHSPSSITQKGRPLLCPILGEEVAEDARVIVDEARILAGLFKTEHPMEPRKVLLSTNSDPFLPIKVYQRGSKHVSSVIKLVTRIRQICTEAYGQSA